MEGGSFRVERVGVREKKKLRNNKRKKKEEREGDRNEKRERLPVSPFYYITTMVNRVRERRQTETPKNIEIKGSGYPEGDPGFSEELKMLNAN